MHPHEQTIKGLKQAYMLESKAIKPVLNFNTGKLWLEGGFFIH